MSGKSRVISGKENIQLSRKRLRKYFLYAALLAAIIIFIGVFTILPWLATLGSLSVMGIYIVITSDEETIIDMPRSVIGDSYYYLGFLLTLIALVAALMHLSYNNNTDINTITGSFGAALITTIVGLGARIYKTSFDVQSTEKRERLENEIENSVKTFSGQLETLTNEVTTSLAIVNSETKIQLEKNLKNYEDVNNQLMTEYTTSMKRGHESISNAMNILSSKIEVIEVSPDIVSLPINNALLGIIETLKKCEARYSDITESMIDKQSILTSQLDQSGNIMQEHVNSLELAITESISKQALQYDKSLGEIGMAIINSLGDIKDLKLDVQDQLNGSLSGFNSEIEGITASFHAITEPILNTSATLQTGTEKLANSLEALSVVSESLSSISQISTDSSEGMSNVSSEIESLQQSLQKFNSQLLTSTESTANSSKRLSDVTASTEEATSQVAKDITQVYKQLATQLQSIRSDK